MVEIEFNYKGRIIIIQANPDDKMKDILQKIIIKTQKNIDDINCMYGENEINENMSFIELATSEDKQRKKMCIFVDDKINKNKLEQNKNTKKAKNIICPKCKENIRLYFKNYKISLYDCKNNHKIEDILLNEFEKTQNIDESKIICDICKKTNKSETLNNKFFICFSCNINICPLCFSNHDKNHNIIDYEKKQFIFNMHSELFNLYCQECKKDICLKCQKEHNGHKIIYYDEIMPEISNLNEEIQNLKIKIDKYKRDIKEI